MKIARVVLPVFPDREFDYSVPAAMNVAVGQRVLVDFRGQKSVALLAGTRGRTDIKKIKPILSVIDDRPLLWAHHLALAARLCRIYPYSPGVFLWMMLPALLKKGLPVGQAGTPVSAGVGADGVGPIMAGGRQPPLHQRFVKADTFLERYAVWKGDLDKCLLDRSALICFPQVSCLEAAYSVMKKDFGERITILHSRLSPAEYLRRWSASRNKSLVLGIRSGFFCQPDDTGLVILEEENSHHYVSQERPFYHTQEAALALSDACGTDLILSGPYPSLRSYSLIKSGKLALDEAAPAEFKPKVVDISGRPTQGALGAIAQELIRREMSAGKKVLLFYEKSGYASRLTCGSCGWTITCSRCSASLKFFSRDKVCLCPYCGKQYVMPAICPACKQGYLLPAGAGLERVTNALRAVFPDQEVVEWEKQTVSARIVTATAKIFSDPRPQLFDCGIILDADSLMYRHEYDAAFQLFLYSRRVAVFCRQLYIFSRAAGTQVFKRITAPWREFYDKELALRRRLSLPPAGFLIRLVFRSKSENKAYELAQRFKTAMEPSRVEVYGPLKEYPFKMRDQYRFSLTAKMGKNKGSRFSRTLEQLTQKNRSSGVKIAIEIR